MIDKSCETHGHDSFVLSMDKGRGKSAKRVFIGLPVPLVLQERVAEFRREHPALPLRWIEPENLHVTLIPPWSCSELEPICETLSLAASHCSPIELSFRSVTSSHGRHKHALLWATGHALPPLLQLYRELRDLLGDLNLEKRNFLMHLTLARFRPQQAGVDGCYRVNLPVEWKAECDRLSLYLSHLKPSGAEYRVLSEALFSSR